MLLIISVSVIPLLNSTNYQPAFAAAPGDKFSPPSVSNWGPGEGGHLNAFVLGPDGSVWNSPFFGSTWHSWVHTGNTGDPGHPPGITITSSPAAISRDIPNKIIDVFAKGSDNSIWRLCFNGANWGQWAHAGSAGDPGHPPGITITSAPAVTSWSSTDLHVFARGSDNNVWYNYFHASISVGTCNGVWSGWRYVNPQPDVNPVWSLNLGYDSGIRDTGWEWGSSQYPQAHPDRLTSFAKNSIQPPSPDPNGINALKATLKPGDKYTGHDGSVSARAEVVLTKNLPRHTNNLFSEGDDVWYHWYTLFPSGYQTDPRFQVWTQWHQDDSAPLPSDCQPPNVGCTPTVEFDVSGSTLSLRVQGHIYDHDPAKCSSTDCGYKWKANLQTKIGQWFDMLLHVKWSKDPNVGFMEMYIDRNKVLDKSKHFATLDKTSNGNPISVYLKQGLYHHISIGVDQTLYHDGMQVVNCPPGNAYYRPDTKLCSSNPPYS
jgi:Polysaccharide lyase